VERAWAALRDKVAMGVLDAAQKGMSYLLDPKNRQRQSREWQGKKREFYAFNYGSHYIWGATAAILVNFAQKLRAP